MYRKKERQTEVREEKKQGMERAGREKGIDGHRSWFCYTGMCVRRLKRLTSRAKRRSDTGKGKER
jgi:hypothetical protein